MEIKQNISLSKYSSYKIGGPAKFFAKVRTREDIISVLKKWRKVSENLPESERQFFILGGGTNVLINDEGFGGLVIYNKIKEIRILGHFNLAGSRHSTYEVGDIKILVGSGVLIEDLLNYCIENSLSGLEWAGGLPGTVGGAIRGNAGAFAGETKDSVFEVTSLKCSDVLIHHYKNNNRIIKIIKRKNKECRFGYRSSVFKSQKESEIIISVVLKLRKGDKDLIRKQIEEKISYRRQRHPLEYPNIGSIFKNIPTQDLPQNVKEEFKDKIKTDPFPVLPSVKLIAGAGLSEKREGDIMVSPKHPNFLVNMGDGKSKDVLSLIKIIKKKVLEKYAVVLEEEITII